MFNVIHDNKNNGHSFAYTLIRLYHDLRHIQLPFIAIVLLNLPSINHRRLLHHSNKNTIIDNLKNYNIILNLV